VARVNLVIAVVEDNDSLPIFTSRLARFQSHSATRLSDSSTHFFEGGGNNFALNGAAHIRESFRALAIRQTMR
jgi:hypothetical protein